MTQDKCNCEYWRGMAMEALTRSAAISFVCPEHGAATIDIRPVQVIHNHLPYQPPQVPKPRPGPFDPRPSPIPRGTTWR